MARPLRIEYDGAFYHVTSRGNELKRIFYAKADYEKFISYLRDAQEKYRYLLHCYVLMTNHYHLLIETPHANMSKVMHYINGSYTNHFNRKRKRSGHLFQGRYKAVLVDRDSYILELSRYLHLNPVNAKLAARPQDYPYSSYRSYAIEGKEDLVYRDLVLELISKDGKDALKKYRDFVEGSLGEKLKNPLTEIYGGAILGGRLFIKEAMSRLKDGILQREETSNRKQLQALYGSVHIIDTLSAYFKVPSDEVFTNTRGYRNLAIYLMKRFTGMTNRQIGELFGALSYSAIAKVHQRLSAKLRNDQSLRKTVEPIMTNLSLVKG